MKTTLNFAFRAGIILALFFAMSAPVVAQKTALPCNCPAPVNLQVLYLSPVSYAINWTPPADSGPVTGYTVRTTLLPAGTVVSEDIVAGPPYIKTGLSPNSRYRIEVFSRCRCGLSTPLSMIIDTPVGIIMEDIIVQRTTPNNLGPVKATNSWFIEWSGSGTLEYVKVISGGSHIWIKKGADDLLAIVNSAGLFGIVNNAPVYHGEVSVRSNVTMGTTLANIELTSSGVLVTGGSAVLERY
ncbi:MAG: fibronectin type III domain-containing protein [Saprospiraceae bacterium]|nr:fibronectin type III domain-containing protein [Saprospiraceae bacterium]